MSTLPIFKVNPRHLTIPAQIPLKKEHDQKYLCISILKTNLKVLKYVIILKVENICSMKINQHFNLTFLLLTLTNEKK